MCTVVRDARTNATLNGYPVNFYKVNVSHVVYIGNDVSDGNGVARLDNYFYPNDGQVWAFNCTVPGQGGGGSPPQGVVCQPVMLTVARATKLSLQVSKDEESSDHTISGKLQSWIGNNPVTNRIVTIKINETNTGDYFEENVTTDNNGEFDLPRTFKALESGTANYLISAVFAGEYGGHVEA